MKKLIALISVILVCAVWVITTVPAVAYERKDHDRIMNQMLFGPISPIDSTGNLKKHLNVLECACYLSIDQFNSNGEGDLRELKDYGVKNLPKSVEDKNYYFSASGSNHRNFTHMGWNFTYQIDLAHWDNRKIIMLSTADKVFDFKGNERQKDSFCALLYYIHIIGDHLDDDTEKLKKGIVFDVVNNGRKIDIGGRTDKNDIINELKRHLAIIFEDQENGFMYRGLINTLDYYNNLFYTLVRNDENVNLKEKKELTDQLFKTLYYYIPDMLKSEKFFSEVFY